MGLEVITEILEYPKKISLCAGIHQTERDDVDVIVVEDIQVFIRNAVGNG